MFGPRVLTSLGLMMLLLAACTPYPETCPSYTAFDLSGADIFPSDDSLPFQFPVIRYDPRTPTRESSFAAYGRSTPNAATEYHAAEDSFHPAGTPVYAMADGRVSFSGPMGGYGWLVIIDHPQANVYSLYGHLSPSRWRIRSGTVEKGELIAYLGDPDENGGSAENPLAPHVHFGVRAGQRADYPGRGEWRFQAGWIRLCPQDLGWLQPSVVIPGQDIPVGGFPEPAARFLDLWGVELLITGIYALGGVSMFALAVRKNAPLFTVLPGILLIAAGIVFHNNGMMRTPIVLVIGVGLAALGIWRYIRRAMLKPAGPA